MSKISLPCGAFVCSEQDRHRAVKSALLSMQAASPVLKVVIPFSASLSFLKSTNHTKIQSKFEDYFSTDPSSRGEAILVSRELFKIPELAVYGKTVTSFRLFDGRIYDSEEAAAPRSAGKKKECTFLSFLAEFSVYSLKRLPLLPLPDRQEKLQRLSAQGQCRGRLNGTAQKHAP